MVVYRVALVNEEYPFHCLIGMELPASAAGLAYDVVVSLVFSGIFIKYGYFPNTAQQTAHQASSLRIIARRSLVATLVALVTAAIHYCVLIFMGGQQRGLIASTIAALVSDFDHISVYLPLSLSPIPKKRKLICRSFSFKKSGSHHRYHGCSLG